MFRQTQLKLTLFFSLIMGLVICILTYSFHENLEESLVIEQEAAVLGFAEEEAFEHSIFIAHGYTINPIEQAEMNAKSNSRNMFFYVVDQEGKLINQVKAGVDMEEALLDSLKNWPAKPGEVVVTQVGKKQIMMASMEIKGSSGVLGTVYVGRDLTSAIQLMEGWTFRLVLLGSVTLFFAIFLSYWMAFWVMVPIKKAYEKQKKFSADASHELRTPLSVIFSSIEVLEKAGEKRSRFENEVLQGLKEEACQMNHLVSDLLLLARADNPYVQQISKESFDLAKLIEKVINKLTPLAEEKGIDLTWAGTSILVEGDQGKLEQVLTILIDNGFNYNQDGGWIRVDLVEKRKEILLKVSDNGKGIPKEHQPKIFDRFYRAEVSRVQEPQGTGLGLSIAYELVRLHGGKIEVISEIGKGSTFTVTLPGG